MSSARVAPVTVFCADDQSCFRDVLRGLVSATPGLLHVGEAASGQEAITALTFLRPDMVIIDVRMPGLDGFDTARILKASRRDLVVVLVSAEPIEGPPGFAPRGGQVALVCKQDLCPRVLLDVWHGRRTR